jgi:murein endopeptidase
VPGGDGCDKSLDHWFTDAILRIKIPEFGGSSRGLKLKDLPSACAAVLNAPANPASAGTQERPQPR